MRLSVPVLLALVLLSVACVTTGPGGKTSLVLISSGQEVAIGSGMAEEIARTEKTLPDSAWQEYLNDVGQRIVAVCDRKDIQYSFTVIESEQINAFAAPGGFIYFYTGLLREMDSEAEMAAVVAHEVSHVVARHGAKRLQAALGVSLAYQLATGNESSEVLDVAVGIGLGLLFAGYSRENEHEADGFGLTYLVRAGYDPHGMEAMLEKLATLGSKSSNIFERLTSSHPETQERISNTKARIAGLLSLPPDLILGKDRYRAMLDRLPPQASPAGSGS